MKKARSLEDVFLMYQENPWAKAETHEHHGRKYLVLRRDLGLMPHGEAPHRFAAWTMSSRMKCVACEQETECCTYVDNDLAGLHVNGQNYVMAEVAAMEAQAALEHMASCKVKP